MNYRILNREGNSNSSLRWRCSKGGKGIKGDKGREKNLFLNRGEDDFHRCAPLVALHLQRELGGGCFVLDDLHVWNRENLQVPSFSHVP